MFGWFKKKPIVPVAHGEEADIVPTDGVIINGKWVSNEHRDKILDHYSRRIDHCDRQIEKWSLRIKSGTFIGTDIPDMKKQIAAIKSTKEHFIKLTDRIK